MINYPELLVPAIIAFLVVLWVLPWHFRLRNIATLSMCFWMTALNLSHIVNALMWNSDADNKAPAWCDISVTITVGYNFGLPLSHLLLARQLENTTTLRSKSVVNDTQMRQRRRVVDAAISVSIPVIGILLHLSQQDRRFYVLEGIGCAPATYWDTWGMIGMALVPVCIAVLAGVYTVMALVNIHLRRQKMMEMCDSVNSLSKDQFLRLFFIAIAEYGTCLLRAIFNMTAYTNGPQPLRHLGDPKKSLKLVSALTRDEISATSWKVQLLQWYTVTACSFIFFICFATSAETLDFYWRWSRKIFPCVPEQRPRLIISGNSSSRGSSRGLISDLERSDSYKKHTSRSEAYSLSYLKPPSTPMSPETPQTPSTAGGSEGEMPFTPRMEEIQEEAVQVRVEGVVEEPWERDVRWGQKV